GTSKSTKPKRTPPIARNECSRAGASGTHLLQVMADSPALTNWPGLPVSPGIVEPTAGGTKPPDASDGPATVSRTIPDREQVFALVYRQMYALTGARQRADFE